MRRLIYAAAIGLAAPLAAQSPTPPSPAALAKARELLTLTRADQLSEKLIDAQMRAVTNGLANQMLQNGQFPAGATKDPEFGAILQRYMDGLSTKVIDQIKAALPKIVEIDADIYARNFTVAQMDDMISFYRSPTGQATLQKLPQVTAEAASATRDLIFGPIIREAQASAPQLSAELKAWAEKHPSAGGTK